MGNLDKHEREMFLSGQFAALGEVSALSGILFTLHKMGVMDIMVEPPTWVVVFLIVSGLFCVWRGHKHH